MVLFIKSWLLGRCLGGIKGVVVDMYLASDLLPVGTDRKLAETQTFALFGAAGVSEPGPLHLHNSAANMSKLPSELIHAVAGRNVRDVWIGVLIPPNIFEPKRAKSSS